MTVVYENESFSPAPGLSDHLAQILGGNLRTEPGGCVRILRVAGSLRLPDGSTLSIRSRKAPLSCLLTWAAYAYPELSALRHVSPSLSGADAGDIATALARVFCDELHRAIQQSGLLRHYRRHDVVSPVVRGRIDFPRLARMGTNLAQLPCVVFSRLPNTPLNALLATAIATICRDPVMRRAAGPALGSLSSMFADVRPRIDVELATNKKPLSRLERPFAPSLALALLLVHAHGLTAGTSVHGLSFLINLANLFERSVARMLTDEIEGASAKRALPYFRGHAGDTRFAGSMQIDVLLERFDRERPIIVDAKYKFAPDSANLQQMLTYCWMTGARQAVLVFPAGHIDDRRSFHYRGADGSMILVHLLELDTDATDLEGWATAGRRLVASIREAVGAAI
jgi:5-methylcytosine-specific restriction endonuclease McrBC regulatory subunit McrC